MEKVSPQRVQWHPGFVSAMKLELKENKGDLEYTSEYGINTKPILIDLLIVKKKPDVIINNEIGDIFSKYNIIEYKSPDDELNIDDYFKVMAYACLYKSHGDNVNGIKSNEVTISFVRSSRPNELFDVLKSDHGISARKVKDGVYYLDNNPFFAAQVIVTSELESAEHVWLKALSKRISKEEVTSLLRCAKKLNEKGEKEDADSVIQVVASANRTVVIHQ